MSIKISELTYDQKCHMAWRLDKKTYCGLMTAIKIVKLEYGDSFVYEVFMKMGKTKKSAKIQETKIRNFKKVEEEGEIK